MKTKSQDNTKIAGLQKSKQAQAQNEDKINYLALARILYQWAKRTGQIK